jgi:hypothetical protein
MDRVKAAREKPPCSPSSVTYLNDSTTKANDSISTFVSRRSFEEQSVGCDLASGLLEQGFRSPPKSQVAPFRYRPISAKVLPKDQYHEDSISTNIDRVLLVSSKPTPTSATHEQKELYIHPPRSEDHFNIPSVPDFNGSCSTRDISLDGDQWVDKRKIPATTANRSGRRQTRDQIELDKTYDAARTFINDVYRAAEHHRNMQIRAFRNMQIRAFRSIPNAPDVTDRKIEVYPGAFMRLRGADETWNAIKYDFYMPCMCICCNLTLFCIQDAIFVLCPACRSVSPLDGVILDGYDGGVGLGFTIGELNKWQKGIAFGQGTDTSVKSNSKYAQG